jgi:hypothetical protein
MHERGNEQGGRRVANFPPCLARLAPKSISEGGAGSARWSRRSLDGHQMMIAYYF